MMVAYYATKNRRSPYVCLIDVNRWMAGPKNAGVKRSCMAGIRLITRPAVQAEIEFAEASYRHVAISWTSFHAMVREEASTVEPGIEFARKLIEAAREFQPALRRLKRDRRRKADAHARKLKKNRGE